MCLHVKK